VTSPAETKAIPLVVENVTKTFRQGQSAVDALSSITLSVESGKFVAVMGASGSGKSTLLHAIAGLTSLDSGTITIDGNDLSKMSDRERTFFRRRQIGLVFQAFNLIPVLTAEDNIMLPVLADGRDGSIGKEQVDALLERLELSPRRRHRPDALSGGEQQRVAIARALITDPSIILADEPTGSLDSVTGQSICQLLKDLSDEQNRTIVMVTHEPTVAIWAEEIVVLKDGHVLTSFATSDFSDAHSLAAHYQDIVSAEVAEESCG